VRRVLSLRVAAQDLAAVKSDFARDRDSVAVVALDDTTCKLAADLAETTGARTLDAAPGGSQPGWRTGRTARHL